MHIMIHACPAREWYVTGFLVPSLIRQGIPPDDIEVYMDRDRKGNLASCIDSFKRASERAGETWHLQDDVVVCRDFADRASKVPEGIVCGFSVARYETTQAVGETIAGYMWQSSFPCIKIPNHIAGEFSEWLTKEAMRRDDLHEYIATGKKDDTLFHIFMREKHFSEPVTNLIPHLADHIDWLIGGSVINRTREFVARASHWEDEETITELKAKLAGR